MQRPQRPHQDQLRNRQPFDERTATFFVTTSHGLEEELVNEIVELAQDLKIELPQPPQAASAGVYVRAPWNFAIAMNFSLRCGSRVLCEILETEVESVEDLYRQVERLNWTAFFSPDKTFIVTATATDSVIKAPALTLKLKDALVDSFRKRTGERPSVDKIAPQVRVIARLHRRKLSVSLDTTGNPLSQRGYRVAGGDAPLSELLAAGLLRMTGWSQFCRAIHSGAGKKVFFSRVQDSTAKRSAESSDESSSQANSRRIPAQILLTPDLLDPMCGTGTFAIEAALQLLNRRPQIERKFFAYTALNVFPETSLRQSEGVRRQIRSMELSLVEVFDRLEKYRVGVLNREESGKGLQPPIHCRDYDALAISSAKRNAEAAGVSKLLNFEVGDVSRLKIASPEGIVVMNPPYGVRLGEEEELRSVYKGIGDTLKKNCRGWQAWILAGSDQLAGSVGLRATRRKKVFNGGLECTWSQYVLF
jgi:putative N6-adenine-specific DNA methylase